VIFFLPVNNEETYLVPHKRQNLTFIFLFKMCTVFSLQSLYLSAVFKMTFKEKSFSSHLLLFMH